MDLLGNLNSTLAKVNLFNASTNPNQIIMNQIITNKSKVSPSPV